MWITKISTMMMRQSQAGTSSKVVAAGLIIGVVAGACGSGQQAADILTNTRELSLDACDPSGGSFSLEITNPFLPYPEGARWVLESDDERVEITVLPDTEVVAGVTTRVVEEREWQDGQLVEVSRNFVAQAADGTVCYFGESVDDYEDGQISGHGGAWRADEADSRPGILMAAKPEVGISHKQEVSKGAAEDTAVVVGLGEEVTVPAGKFTDTLSTVDVNPVDNEVDEKKYARGVGIIVDEDLLLLEYSL